jgi:hypothetical protein
LILREKESFSTIVFFILLLYNVVGVCNNNYCSFLYLCQIICAKKNRNQFNKLPVGNLRQQGDRFVDSAGTVWIQRPYIMSLMHNPNENYVFETYDKFIQSSSEAIANKTLFDKGTQVFTYGSFNYCSPFHNPFLHFITMFCKAKIQFANH